MYRPIAPGLSPNVEGEDVLAALASLIRVTSYQKGPAITQLETWFEDYFHAQKAISFASGRGALTAILMSMGIGKGDEVLVQAFTCRAVIDAIVWTGATPVYVDCTDTLGMDLTDAEKKCTKATKVLLLQHTFGIPADAEKAAKFAKKHNLFFIEDVAHTIGAKEGKHLLGTFSDAALFSFGRDKAFSSVCGGMVITKNQALGEKIEALQENLSFPSRRWILQQLLHPILFWILIMPLYDVFDIGKLVLVVLQKIHVLSVPVRNDENEKDYVKKYPNALARIARTQLQRLDMFNKKRSDFVKFYQKQLPQSFILKKVSGNLPLLRFPIIVEQQQQFKQFFRKHTVYIGDWYSNVIDPKGTSLSTYGYTKGSCPHAEYVASHILNLPTYPTLTSKDAEKIVMILKAYGNNKTDTK